MDISYELYKVLYHMAVTLSFSKASRQLPISQSTVSQSIRVLEKRLDQTLFIRSTKRVQLAPEGGILSKHIGPAMNLIKQRENQLLKANTLSGNQLRIGAGDTICRYYLLPYLNQSHKMYPHVHVRVTNQTSIECARLLEHGQIDFVIINHPSSALSTAYTPQVLREFRDVFVASRGYFPFQNKVMGLLELQPYPILMLDRKSTTSEFLHAIFQKSQLDLIPEIELSNNDLLIGLAHIGSDIAFVPGLCIPEDDRDLFVLKLEQSLPAKQIVVTFSENLPISQAAGQFMDTL